jgi:hypothetical protein
VFTHYWLKEVGRAEIFLRLVDGDTYVQEVFELSEDGTRILENRSTLRRQRN